MRRMLGDIRMTKWDTIQLDVQDAYAYLDEEEVMEQEELEEELTEDDIQFLLEEMADM